MVTLLQIFNLLSTNELIQLYKGEEIVFNGDFDDYTDSEYWNYPVENLFADEQGFLHIEIKG